MHNTTPAKAAAQEAYEEAGTVGKVRQFCLGIYSYVKVEPNGDHFTRVVAVFPYKVKKLLKEFPEAGQRKRKWLGRKKAAARVKEPELAAMIRHFDPSRLPK